MSKAIENFERLVLIYLPRMRVDLDISNEDCYAIFGNFGHESNGMSTLQEIKPTVAGSKGGWGWAQWTGPRRRQFEDFCKKHNFKEDSAEANYRFFLWEVENTEKGAIPKLKAASTLYAKVVAFENGYERAGVKHYESRLTWAVRAKTAFENHLAQGKEVKAEEEKPMFEGMIMTWLLNKAKAIIAYFLTGLVVLIIQSIEQGGGISIPDSAEAWITSGISALLVAIGVYAVPNKSLPK